MRLPRRSLRSRPLSFRPTLEALEDRITPVTLSNGIPSGTVGEFKVNIQTAGDLNVGQGSEFTFAPAGPHPPNPTVYTKDTIYLYYTYIDIGSGGNQLSDPSFSTITQSATLVGNTVVSKGNFIGSGGQTINWTTTDSLTGGGQLLDHQITFNTASALGLGNLKVIQYLDQDITPPMYSTDLLVPKGSVAANNLLLFTINANYLVGFGMGGPYLPSAMQNATYLGWAASDWNSATQALRNTIPAGTQTWSPTGVLDTTPGVPLNPFFFPPLNQIVYGTSPSGNDVGAAMAWQVSPTAMSASVTPYIQGVPTEAGLPVIVTAIPTQTVGQAFSTTLAAQFGVPFTTGTPYQWALASGALPPGLTLNVATGLLSGTPTTGGTYNFTLSATDSAGAVGTRAYTVLVNSPPVVSSLSPTTGSAGGGTAVTITGTNFTGATSVLFGSNAATGVTVVSSTKITATSPAGAGTVDVTVTTPVGTSAASASDKFTYAGAPTVTGIAPTSGAAAGGTAVVITGTNFTGATSVLFGSNPATAVIVVSSTKITATSPAGAATVDVTVTTPAGTSTASASDKFTYVPAPTITAIAPATGPVAGNTVVTITGTNFTGVTGVKFGGATAAFTVNSATKITATSPAGGGTVDVTVTALGGTSTTSAADQFTYAIVPTITSLSASSGPTAGGAAETITGLNFTGATSVKFGSTAVAFTVVNATTITTTSPAGSGSVDVTVITPGGTSALSAADKFTYVPAPTITSVSPNLGAASGGTGVTITGTNFTGATSVMFGTSPAAGFTVVSATKITATSPLGAGLVDVKVTTPNGSSAVTTLDRFTYVAAPTITTITPSVGPTTGGTVVTITGTNFTGVTGVSFGGTAASGVTVLSATQLRATAPAGAAGPVNVTVTAVGGTSATSAADLFTYLPVPTISSVSPNVGPAAGGTVVTITGIDFTGATSVKFGTTAAASFTVNSNTQITATTHAGSGIVDVHVSTAGGTSVASAADQYDFMAAPTITSVSPNVGPLTGGTSVLITGNNFNGATSVMFGASAGTSVSILSNMQISVTNPAGSGIVNVSVTTPYGTSAVTTADYFTYVALPTVTKVSPATGLTTGGTSVTITGTNLANATFVFFGTLVVPRTSFVSNSATQIVLKSPADPTVGPVDVTVTTVGGTSATSSADQFTYEVTPSLQVSSQPASITAGQPISLQVQAFDQLDNLNTNFNKAVTATLKIPTGGGALVGTPQASYSGGTVTLTGFTITKAATGYQLVLSSTGLTSTTTVSFDVTADAPTQLVVVTQPVNTTPTAPLPAVVVLLKDQYGNGVVGQEVDLAGAGLTGSGMTDNTGQVHYTNLLVTTVGTYQLTFTSLLPSGSTATVLSNPFQVAIVLSKTRPGGFYV